MSLDKPIGTSLPEVCLYWGTVMHARMGSVTHRFTYKVFSVLLDIDRLQTAGKKSWLFSVNKKGPVSFHEKDHGLRNGENLRTYVDREHKSRQLSPPNRVFILCYPRVLGYVFNPLSVYFCFDEVNRMTTVIYQVHNTFGGAHTYLETVSEQDMHTGVVRQECGKDFYVSPFIEMAMQYRFRVRQPGKQVRVRILETDRGEPLLSATFSGERQPLKTRNLLSCLVKSCGLTLKVTAGIHFEALRLWLKGLKIVPRAREDSGKLHTGYSEYKENH